MHCSDDLSMCVCVCVFMFDFVMYVYVCLCACMRACVGACVRACVFGKGNFTVIKVFVRLQKKCSSKYCMVFRTPLTMFEGGSARCRLTCIGVGHICTSAL